MTQLASTPAGIEAVGVEGGGVEGGGVEADGRREIVSFGSRRGRLDPRRQRAWDAWAGTYVMDVPKGRRSTGLQPGGTVDWAAVFGRRAPMVVEIGCGAGEALHAAARDAPDVSFLAIEVYLPGIASALARVGGAGLTNVRLLEADAAEVLATLVAPAALREVWTYFPDPWHKRRHHKRRLVSSDFAALVASRLEPGGTWRLATDGADYAEQMLRAADACSDLVNPHSATGGYAPRFAGRPVTRYERKALGAGRTVLDLELRRR